MDMAIFMATVDLKQASVSHKYKSYIDDKRYQTSGIGSGVAGAGICGGGSEF